MEAWEKYEYLKERMGAEALLDALAQALNTDELDDNMDFIAKGVDVDFDEEET